MLTSFNDQVSNIYIVKQNRMTVKPNHDFECSSRNVLYIAICTTCKEFYLGETGDELSTRWTVHRQQSKLAPGDAPVHADVHFRLCGRNCYKVFPFYRPRKNDMDLRRRYMKSISNPYTDQS